MNKSTWSQAEKIIDGLVDRCVLSSDSDLADALQEALAGESEDVRREVESLVSFLFPTPSASQDSAQKEASVLSGKDVAQSTPRLLEGLAQEARPLHNAAASPNSPVAGERIGPYLLIDEIGRGGMGVVFLAERADQQFEKRVAIKLLGGASMGAGGRQRFLRERQILAGLEHPSIARLLDGGVTKEGSPYLVMELVEGEPIDRYCDRSKATIERRLELFLEVCDAVHAAHIELVAHRDIKPANILVTGDGRVKLLDFGIAGLVEEAQDDARPLTMLHAFTPNYASPEQVKLERAGTASDVYSLGVLLFRLLARQLPYDTSNSSPAEVERMVCHMQPSPPSTVLASAPGDIRADIEGESLSKQQRSRLARRVQGDLDQIVLKALSKESKRRYPTAAEFAEDIRRHQRGWPIKARPSTLRYRAGRFIARQRLAVGAGIAIVASLVLGLGLALTEGQRAQRERDLAQRETVKARTISTFLTELFEGANPYEAAPPTARDLLARGEQKIDRTLREMPFVRADLLGTMSRAYRGMGDYSEALRLSTAALELKQGLLDPSDPQLAAAHLDHASTLNSAGDAPGALHHARASMAILADAGLDTGGIAVRAHRLLGEYEQPQSLAESEKHLLRALELQRQLTPESSKVLAFLLHDLAVLRERQGRQQEGQQLKRDALAMLEPLVELGAPVIHQLQANLAIALSNAGDLSEAEPLFVAALAGMEARLGEYHPDMIAQLTTYGQFLLSQGRFVEATPLIEKAATIANTLDSTRFDAIAANINLATLFREQDRAADALLLYRDAQEQFQARGIGKHSSPSARLESHLGRTLARLGRDQDALASLESALLDQEADPAALATHAAETRSALGAVLCRQSDHLRGLALVKNSCSVFESNLGADHWQTAGCYVEQAFCEAQADQLTTALTRIQTSEQALATLSPRNYWRRRSRDVKQHILTLRQNRSASNNSPPPNHSL